MLRASVLTANTDPHSSILSYPYPYTEDPFARHARPSSAYLGPPTGRLSPQVPSSRTADIGSSGLKTSANNTITYHGVCLTVWSHADAERTAAIRRTLEVSRARKESAQSLVSTRKKSSGSVGADPAVQARRRAKNGARGPWGAGTDGETDLDPETDGEALLNDGGGWDDAFGI